MDGEFSDELTGLVPVVPHGLGGVECGAVVGVVRVRTAWEGRWGRDVPALWGGDAGVLVPAVRDQFLTWRDSPVRTPSSELVTLKTKGRYGSGGSDDHTPQDQLKLDAPVKLDGPVDEQVEHLSNRQWVVGGEAQTGTAYVDSATGPVFNWPTRARNAVPKLQVEWKSELGAALRSGRPYPPLDLTSHPREFGARSAFWIVPLVLVSVLWRRETTLVPLLPCGRPKA